MHFQEGSDRPYPVRAAAAESLRKIRESQPEAIRAKRQEAVP
jgi:hypothetical protein